MAVENENYKLEILEYAINQSINQLLPDSSKDALSVILYRSNEVVWKVATDIYSKSGHQTYFSFIKNILNSRIKPLRNKIAEEERIRKEQEIGRARIKVELEAQRLVRKTEQERRRKEEEAEKTRIRAKLKAEEEKIRKQKGEARQKKLQEFCKVYPNVSIDAFIRIEAIIAKELLVEEEKISLNSILSQDLGADTLDVVELIQAIEEEFDIEIPDDFTGTNWIFCICGDYSRLESITVKEIVDIVFEKIQ